jgi:hypothetical protein
MIINSITDLTQANEIIDSILNNTNELLPLDQFTHNCIINDRIDYLRHVASANHTYDEYVASYVTEHGELTNDHLNYGITEYPEVFQMIYPFSKNHFFKTFYSNVLPSVMNSYYSYMKKNNRIMQIGSGAGKCLLIKPVYFSENDLNAIKSLEVNYSTMSQLLVQATDHLAKQENDIKFLLDKVESSQSFYYFLEKKIEILETQLINNTTHTWR